MKRSRRITVLMDANAIPSDNPELLVEPDEASTEFHVVNALRGLDHHVEVLGVDHDVEAMILALKAQAPELVFNLTELFAGDRRQDRNIAAVLEMLGLPFTGSGVRGLLLCRDKGLSKQLLSHHRIRVPGFAIFSPGDRVTVSHHLTFPVVVKPMLTDGSEGISNASLVSDEDGLRSRVRLVHERWQQPAIAEEYIAGRELYVSVLGNRRLQVLPPRELFFRSDEVGGPVMATYRVKWDAAYQAKWNIRFGNAELEDRLQRRVSSVCRRVFRILHLQDYGRVDLRVTADGRIVILEVNPNPDIAWGEEVAEAAERVGISYPELLTRIMRQALRRSNVA